MCSALSAPKECVCPEVPQTLPIQVVILSLICMCVCEMWHIFSFTRAYFYQINFVEEILPRANEG